MIVYAAYLLSYYSKDSHLTHTQRWILHMCCIHLSPITASSWICKTCKRVFI